VGARRTSEAAEHAQGARRGDAQRVERLRGEQLAHGRAQDGAPVEPAREGGPSGALDLELPRLARGRANLGDEDGAPVAEARHEDAELVAGVGGGDRLDARGGALPVEEGHELGAVDPVEAERARGVVAPGDDPRLVERGDALARPQRLGELRVAADERERVETPGFHAPP
jgi:hypothetical protein